MMYLLVLVLALGILRLLRLRVLLFVLATGLAALQWDAFDFLDAFGFLLAFFAIGMVLYKLRGSRVFDGRIALLALLGLAASTPLQQFISLFPLFGGYLAIYLATHPRLPVLRATRFGDLSYGLYIYGWPVQAMVIHAMGGKAAWWQLFLVALPLATLAPWLSWHLVEKHFLRLKPRHARAALLAASERSAMAAAWPWTFPSAAISRSSTASSPR